jgi:hypothetical protein
VSRSVFLEIITREEAQWISLTALLLPLLLGLTAEQTQSVTLHLDPAKTQIVGTLTDVLHTVHGTFALNSGTVTVPSTISVAVPAGCSRVCRSMWMRT